MSLAASSGVATGGTCLPRRLIQTGKGPNLPLLWQAAVANLKLLNPDFEYRFFDDKQVVDFIDENFPEYRRVFDAFPFPIQRYDFFRYLAVYALGGFYFDTDVFLARSLAPLLNRACVFPFEEVTISRYLRSRHGINWEIGNYAFGAAAGHPFLKAVIENCIRAQAEPAWGMAMLEGIPKPFQAQFFVPMTTGPGMVTRTLAENPAFRQSVTILFPENLCDRQTWHRFGDYGVHLMQGSWREKRGALRTRVGWMWTNWVRKRVISRMQKNPETPG
jgi:hypothetical protein